MVDKRFVTKQRHIDVFCGFATWATFGCEDYLVPGGRSAGWPAFWYRTVTAAITSPKTPWAVVYTEVTSAPALMPTSGRATPRPPACCSPKNVTVMPPTPSVVAPVWAATLSSYLPIWNLRL